MKLDAVQTIKYFCILLMIVYTISSFEILSVRNPKRQKIRFHFHNLLIFTFHFLGNMSLIIQQPGAMEALPYVFFYLAQVAFFALYLILYRIIYRGCNGLLLNHTILLLSVSFLILMRINPGKARSQLLYAALASAVSLLIPYIATKIRLTKALAMVLGILGLLLLGAVFVRGKMVYGANLSLNFFGIAIQPSEFVKISFILLIAMMFRKNHSFRRVVLTTMVALAHVMVLVMSKDLGSALIFFVTYLFMLYVATHTIRYSALGLSITAILGITIFVVYQYAVHAEGQSPILNNVVRIFGHVETRINNWLDPWSRINDEGYQIAQSLFAIYSGSWFGRGINKGFPKEIPVVEKDFTFSAIFEEFGGIFCLCLLFVCLSLLLSILVIAVRMKNTFYKLMAVGFASVYGAQVVLVVGGVTKMIPHTGVTLPLVSYGGSSISSTLFLFALTQGLTVLWRREEQEEKRLAEEMARAEEARRKEADEAKKNSGRRKKKIKEKAGELLTAGTEVVLAAADGKSALRKKKKEIRKIVEERKETPKINRNIEVFSVAYFHTICFLSVAIYMIVLLARPADAILNNSYNRARINAEYERVLRGDIYAATGELLATTVTSDTELRYYPNGSVAGHYTGYLDNGKAGLEYLGDYWLKRTGADFWEDFKSEVLGRKRRGYSVISTLDLPAQKLANELLGDRMGAVVALDAETGDILVMVSKPDFDPNTMLPAAYWSEMGAESKNSYLMNRAVSGLYPPGSSFKPITMLAYMRAFPNRWQGEVYDCNGEFVLEDHIIHCANGSAHGEVDFEEALCGSCNGFFANEARSIPIAMFNETTSGLLFRKKLSVKTTNGVATVPALSTATSTATMKENMTDTERSIMGMGQGAVLISPIHSALISAAIVNGGRMPAPRYITEVRNDQNQLIYRAAYETLGEVMTWEEADILKTAMQKTLVKGTGYLAATTEYIAGGKTGSAQFRDGSMDTHAIYTGFGELGERKVAIAVFIENGGSGGQQAAPIAKEVLGALLLKN